MLNGQSQHEFIISGLFGYGFGTKTAVSNISDKTLQPYKYGVATRLGYRFDNKLYIGLAATFQNGESIEVVTSSRTYTVETRIQYYGAEIGRFIPLGDQFSLCPYVGFGVGQLKGNFWGDQISFSSDDVGTAPSGLRPCTFPGMLFQIAMENSIVVGVDIRYMAIIDYQHANAFSLFLLAGIEI